MMPGQPTSTIFITVGTDHHPFDRMVAIAEGIAERFHEYAVFLQVGTSREPVGIDYSRYLSEDEMLRHMAEAAAIIAHGGPATMRAANSLGRRPIVVPRRADLGEHVDDHQLHFAQREAAHATVFVAHSLDEVAQHLAAAVRDRVPLPDSSLHAKSVAAFERAVTEILDRS